MRCPHCSQRDYNSTLTRLNQTADKPGKPSQYRDAQGDHFHDPRVWTATFRCSNSHVFTIHQKLPCPIASCSWNKDPTTKPEVLYDVPVPAVLVPRAPAPPDPAAGE